MNMWITLQNKTNTSLFRFNHNSCRRCQNRGNNSEKRPNESEEVNLPWHPSIKKYFATNYCRSFASKCWSTWREDENKRQQMVKVYPKWWSVYASTRNCEKRLKKVLQHHHCHVRLHGYFIYLILLCTFRHHNALRNMHRRKLHIVGLLWKYSVIFNNKKNTIRLKNFTFKISKTYK